MYVPFRRLHKIWTKIGSLDCLSDDFRIGFALLWITRDVPTFCSKWKFFFSEHFGTSVKGYEKYLAKKKETIRQNPYGIEEEEIKKIH